MLISCSQHCSYYVNTWYKKRHFEEMLTKPISSWHSSLWHTTYLGIFIEWLQRSFISLVKKSAHEKRIYIKNILILKFGLHWQFLSTLQSALLLKKDWCKSFFLSFGHFAICTVLKRKTTANQLQKRANIFSFPIKYFEWKIKLCECSEE